MEYVPAEIRDTVGEHTELVPQLQRMEDAIGELGNSKSDSVYVYKDYVGAIPLEAGIIASYVGRMYFTELSGYTPICILCWSASSTLEQTSHSWIDLVSSFNLTPASYRIDVAVIGRYPPNYPTDVYPNSSVVPERTIYVKYRILWEKEQSES